MKKILKIFENKEKRIENLVFLLIILVITLIIINSILKDEDEDKENVNNNNLISFESEKNLEQSIEVNNLEKRLEETLGKIKGVSKVNVLITYSETEEIVPLYNLNNSKSKTEEGEKITEEESITKDVLLDNSSNVLTQKIISPKMEGAVVIAKGAENMEVKANIISAVEAVTGLASHKIQVFEMGDE